MRVQGARRTRKVYMMNYLAAIQETLKTNQEYAFLNLTTPVGQIEPKEAMETDKGLYQPPKEFAKDAKLNSKLMAVWLNAVLTQRRWVFMNTYRDFCKLVAKDRNLKRNTVSPEEFKGFNHYLLFNKFIDIVRRHICSQ